MYLVLKIRFLMRRFELDEEFLSKTKWETGPIIAYYAQKYDLGNVIHTEDSEEWLKNNPPITVGVNSFNASEMILYSFTEYCLEHHIPIIYPFNMEWGAAIIVSDNNSQINIANKTKTGNYNDDIRAYIGRYVSFWNHQTPASLLLNYNPVFSNTLMLQICLNVVALIATEKSVKLFPDMYYCLCNPGKCI